MTLGVMPPVDLNDSEVVNLAWLLEAIGAGSAQERVDVLAVAKTGSWATSALAKLKALALQGAPAMSNDALRAALGRFAADSKTAEEVDTLRASLNAAYAQLDAGHARLDALGIANDRPGDLAGRIQGLGDRESA